MVRPMKGIAIGAFAASLAMLAAPVARAHWQDDQGSTRSVPKPAALGLLALGLVGIGLAKGRKR